MLLSVLHNLEELEFLLTLVLIVFTSSLPLVLMLRQEMGKTMRQIRFWLRAERRSLHLLLGALLAVNLVGWLLFR